VPGLDHLGRDRRFTTRSARQAADAELTSELVRGFATATAGEWERRARRAGIACVEVDGRGLGEIFSSEEWLVDCKFMAEVDHPILGPLRQHGHHVLLSDTPGIIGVSRPAGSSTRAVLAEAGYSPVQIDELVSRGALRDHL
jgi:crotonobetainyl-CoA:carnitine CoA-transferase CaiB-like acyl-CoA transferase